MAIGIKATDDADGYNWPANIDPLFAYEDQIAGPKTIFTSTSDMKRISITQGDNTIELESEQIKLLQGLADRWIRIRAQGVEDE